MRKIIVLSFISLDGVVQAPGSPEEDTSGGFKNGGWTVPLFDKALGTEMNEQMGKPFDLLLGRKTYEMFASYWPHHPEEGKGINKATKYVASNSDMQFSWDKSVLLKGDVIARIRALKQESGPDIQVHGSVDLLQSLMKNDLIDEYWLKIFPVILGKGKRLFQESVPANLRLTEKRVTPSGVIIASYARDGKLKTGSFA
jgi:dihydrofolate reductase